MPRAENINGRMAFYDGDARYWVYADDREQVPPDIEAKHFSTKVPGEAWAEEDAKPSRARRTPADEADTE